ncbi:type IV pilus secretin PilQ [Haliangium sp.]|uniref:type IV pilus secretin PilQ n=1 Tax=Haliangium sp. TaxID=2663208 RepID=UPI003D1442B6
MNRFSNMKHDNLSPRLPRLGRRPRRWGAATSMAAAALLLGTWSLSAHAERHRASRIVAVDHGAAPAGVAGTMQVRVRGTREPTFTVYKLDYPSRVVVDIAGAVLDRKLTGDDEHKATWSANGWSVGQISIYELHGVGADGSTQGDEQSLVRVVVGMARPGSYRAEADGKDVVITITPEQPAPAQADPAAAAAAARAVTQAKARHQEVMKEIAAAEQRKAAIDAERKRVQAEREQLAAELTKAQAARRQAEAEAGEAERRANEARALRVKEEAAYREVAQARAEAERRAAQARALREKEEKAFREAAQARTEAQRRGAALRQAGERLRSLEAEAAAAKAKATDMGRAAAEAESRLAKTRASKDATERELARARSEARRLAQARAEAEAALSERRREVQAQQHTADQLAEAGRKAERELRGLEAAAAQARQAREAEEKKVAELARRRTALEAELAQARNAVRTARDAWKAQRSEAEAELRKLGAAADEARTRRLREESRLTELSERRKQLERSITAIHDQSRQAAERKAELAALDQARSKARRARQAEEAKLAELVRQREAVEAELSAAQRKARVAAQAERKAHQDEAEAERRALADAESRAQAARSREEARIVELGKRREVLDAAVAQARRTRVREEAKVAELSQSRAALEGEISDLRARVEAATEAERAARSGVEKAENELASLDQAAQQARRARAEEEAKVAELSKRREALQAELAAARTQANRSATAEHKAAQVAKAKAEAELTELDQATRRARQALAAEEARLAELSKRREALEAGRPAAKPAAQSVRVRDVDFVDRDGFARVLLALSSEARPRIVANEKTRVILEIADADLPGTLQRTLDTSAYRGPIRAVSSYRDPEDGSKMRLAVDLAYPTRHTLKRSGNTYYWDFAKSGQRARAVRAAAAGRGTRAGRTRTHSIPAPVVGGYGASSTPITQKTVAQVARQRRKVYRGTKVDLDFKDVDIHNVMRFLADVGGINIVVPDDVQARVTVRLRQVPWDQALEVILASKGLWYQSEGNLYRIATRKQLEAEAEAELARRRALREAEAAEAEIFTLNYAVAGDVKGQVEGLLSQKGSIQIDSRTNTLIISDVRDKRRIIIDLLRRLDTQTPQIQIEARIVEARSTFVREFGVQWGGSFQSANTGLIFPNDVSAAGGAVDNQTVTSGVNAASPDFAVNLPAAVGSGAGGAIGLALGSLRGGVNLNLRLSALENNGSVRIVSAPKITVVNNIQAEISQGVSIPISVISAQGVQTQFVNADLSLRVTPHVSQRDCSISMDIEVEKNEADFVNTGARGDPTILRKEAKTTVLVNDQETTVIGGIYTRNAGLSYAKVPLFGDLPLLGWFFKNRRENDERTEVLVFVTPRITNRGLLMCEPSDFGTDGQ